MYLASTALKKHRMRAWQQKKLGENGLVFAHLNHQNQYPDGARAS
jgi:hypothetical protein